MDINYVENGYKTTKSAFKETMSYVGLSLQSKLSQIVFIDGTFKGNIFTANPVVIKENGNFLGNIKAKTLHVSGKVFGDIDVDSLIIHNAGKVYSNRIKAEKVFVYNDGVCLKKAEGPSLRNNLSSSTGNYTDDTKEIFTERKKEVIAFDKSDFKNSIPAFSRTVPKEVSTFNSEFEEIQEKIMVQPTIKKDPGMPSFVNSF